MSKKIIIKCNDCGTETTRGSGISVTDGWLEEATVGGTRDYCPTCRRAYDTKHAIEELFNKK